MFSIKILFWLTSKLSSLFLRLIRRILLFTQILKNKNTYNSKPHYTEVLPIWAKNEKKGQSISNSQNMSEIKRLMNRVNQKTKQARHFCKKMKYFLFFLYPHMT